MEGMEGIEGIPGAEYLMYSTRSLALAGTSEESRNGESCRSRFLLLNRFAALVFKECARENACVWSLHLCMFYVGGVGGVGGVRGI